MSDLRRWAVSDNNGWTMATFATRKKAVAWAREVDGPVWIDERDRDTGEWFSVERVPAKAPPR